MGLLEAGQSSPPGTNSGSGAQPGLSTPHEYHPSMRSRIVCTGAVLFTMLFSFRNDSRWFGSEKSPSPSKMKDEVSKGKKLLLLDRWALESYFPPWQATQTPGTALRDCETRMASVDSAPIWSKTKNLTDGVAS